MDFQLSGLLGNWSSGRHVPFFPCEKLFVSASRKHSQSGKSKEQNLAMWRAVFKVVANPTLEVSLLKHWLCGLLMPLPLTHSLSSDLCLHVLCFLSIDYCRCHPNMFGTQVYDEGRLISLLKLRLQIFPFCFLGHLNITSAFVLDAFGPNGRHCDDQWWQCYSSRGLTFRFAF